MHGITDSRPMQILDLGVQFEPVVVKRVEVGSFRLQVLIEECIQNGVDFAIKQRHLPLDNRPLANGLEGDFRVEPDVDLEWDTKGNRMQVIAVQLNQEHTTWLDRSLDTKHLFDGLDG